MDELEILIDGLSFFEGHGVGRSKSGKVFFVEGTCPGDIVTVEIVKDSKKFAFSRVTGFIKKSEHRTKPICSVFETCGGCTLQHVNYSLQIEEKQKVLIRYKKRNSNFVLEPFVSSEKKFNYRQRIEVHFKSNKWGFYKKKSHDLVLPTMCPIASKEINRLLSGATKPDGHYHVSSSGIQKRSRGSFGVFSQINIEIDNEIKKFLLKHLSNESNIDQVYDLYAGSGNYSQYLAPHLNQTHFMAVELSEILVNLGQNSKTAVSNIKWVCSDVIDYLQNKKADQFSQATFLVNPPRNGLSKEIIFEISKLPVKQIIYVSCNPMTLFRDIDALSPKFQLKTLKGFDMFPQTMHFETLAILSAI